MIYAAIFSASIERTVITILVSLVTLTPEYPETREVPLRSWIIYSNEGYFLVKAKEEDVWTRQQAYIKERMDKGQRMDQIVFTYQPVIQTMLGAIK